jgi:hypothetical protein
MEKTWASGAIELLNHAYTHMQENSAFDKRIAFISVDNAVELMIKTYLKLPKKFFPGTKPTRKEIEQAFNSFIEYLDLLMKYDNENLSGIDPGDIEHYHRIRNQLYHDGTGLSVDEEYLKAYFTIGTLMLKNLFDVDFSKSIDEKYYSISNLIKIWNEVDKTLKEVLEKHDIFEDTYKWEEMMQKNVLDIHDISSLTNLRMKRNLIVHSEREMSIEEIKLFIDEAKLLLEKLKDKLK